jgi:hypothetical protein
MNEQVFSGRSEVQEVLQQTCNVYIIYLFFFFLLTLPDLQEQLSAWQGDDLH